MLKYAVLLFACSALAGCAANGRVDESGKMNLGPRVFEDDPINHPTYPSFAEYAVATREFDNLKRQGYSDQQVLCISKVMFENLPSSLRQRLDDFASNRTTLMESEFAALYKEAHGYTGDESYFNQIKPKLEPCRR